MGDPEQSRDERMSDLLDQALAELHRGSRLDLPSWQSRYPELAGELPRLLDTLQDLEAALETWKTIPETPFAEAEATTKFPAPHPGAPAERFGRYQVLDRLGAGGMGTVHKAYDPQLRREVALKVPHFERGRPDTTAAVQRFLREARAAAPIRHPHICPIYDVGEQDGIPFVVMALVDGQSLADRLNQVGRFEDVRDAVRLVRQVAAGLAEVHRHGIIHRDLKPGNILLDSTGQAVLTDFGLARSVQDADQLTVQGVLVGTPAYMAPEQAAPGLGDVGPRTDLYSLGVVLYRMVAGRLPFEGTVIEVVYQIGNTPPPAPSDFRADLDPGLVAIIQKCLARRSEDRFASAEVLEQVLGQWLDGTQSYPAAETAAAATPDKPTVVKVDIPGKSPVTITLDTGSARPGKVGVKVVDEPASRKRRRRLTVQISLVLTLLVALLVTLRQRPVEDQGIQVAKNDRETEASLRQQLESRVPVPRVMPAAPDSVEELPPVLLRTPGDIAAPAPLPRMAAPAPPSRGVIVEGDVPKETHGENTSRYLFFFAGASRSLEQGQFAEAEKQFQFGIQLQEKALGPNHPDVAASLAKFATLYRSQNKDDKAEELLQRAAVIRAKQRGNDKPKAPKNPAHSPPPVRKMPLPEPEAGK